MFKITILALLFSISYSITFGQEMIAPLNENPQLQVPTINKTSKAQKPTALSLPFFDDFTNDGLYPDPSKWRDLQVYINNHMALNPPSRGVATFDALNEQGIPYDSILFYHQVYADSLTSQPIDLSSYTPADSIYLSFFFQPKGMGFAPKPTDSLMLFFHTGGGNWNKVWATAGDTANVFKQVMIPIKSSEYLYDNFDFRFVNKATHGISNSQWHIDYIRIDAGRHFYDTTINDVAFTTQPQSILDDFTVMPFRHFDTDRSSFMGSFHGSTIKNLSNGTLSVNYFYSSKELTTLPSWGSGAGIATLSPGEAMPFTFPVYSIVGFTPPDINARIVFENKYYLSAAFADEPKGNDTIRYYQEFDDYFAYDDGTAEVSYFLSLSTGAPGKIAIEYALYRPDTITGVAIRFVRQVPSAANKDFSIAIYKAINPGVGNDEIVYQQDFYLPRYRDTFNQMAYYRFDEPVVLDAGIFYVGIIQPAGGISDSLCIALDRNRVGANHRYFNIGDVWQPSLIDGALMVRPLVGNHFYLSNQSVVEAQQTWSLYPNPSTNLIQVTIDDRFKNKTHYEICDLSGRVLLSADVPEDKNIDVSKLTPGMYVVNMVHPTVKFKPLRFVKL
jgi:hypothetical protein